VGSALSGRYQMQGILGRGGIGVVYAAVDRKTGAEVAIKRLLKPDAETAERLMREARAAMKVEHENTVTVQEVGVDANGAPFLVMERLRGATLSDVIEQRGALAPPVAAAFLAPIAEALAAAHTRGVLHRDLKPNNIFLAVVGQKVVPKILDFGMAKLVGNQSVKLASLTASGAAMGTPFYMSPEQLNGAKDLGPATDAWSFGVLLYEALTGGRPFSGESVGELVVGILQRVPSVGDIEPPELRALIDRCLKKEPEERLTNLGEVHHVLTTIARGMPRPGYLPSPSPMTPSEPPPALAPSPGLSPPLAQPRRPTWLIGLAIAAAVAAASLGFMTRDVVEPEEPPPVEKALDIRPQLRLPLGLRKQRKKKRVTQPTTEVGCKGGGCEVKCPEGTRCDVNCPGGNCSVVVGQ